MMKSGRSYNFPNMGGAHYSNQLGVVNVNNMEAKEAYANWLLDTKKIVNRTAVSHC